MYRRMLEQSNRSNTYGQATTLYVGESRSILQAHGGDEGSELFTIGLRAWPVKPLPIVNFRLRARAHILFGAGGASSTIVCDYSNGTLLTLPATSVRVSAEYLNEGTPADHVPVSFATFLAYGTRPLGASLAPRLTMAPEILPALATGIVHEIPAWAVSAGAWSTLGPTSVEVRFYAGDGTTLIATSGITAGGELVAIPPDARFAAVKNLDAVAAATFEVVFGLGA